MEDQLHIEPALRGAVIGIQPFVEPCIVPFSAILGHRIGIVWLMCIAAALGVIANLLFAAQILMGGVWGVFIVLGILVAQRLVPNAVATASAIFLSSSALSSALGGVAGGIGVATLGLPSVFFIPAACSLLAVVGLTAMAKNYNFH
jgi:SET family sugar efflux transporter-like MFS transporter